MSDSRSLPNAGRICVCGKPLHRGMCAARWALRRGGEDVRPRPVLKVAHRAAPKRRFHEHFGVGHALVLAADNPATREGRTIFPTRVFPAHIQDRLLKSGEHQRKIGSHVVKGKLAGAPIYTLTLEERATCPRDCRQWRACYGNGMPWSVRIAPDDVMLDRLALELRGLADRHPRFLVRLHILGDFYSVAYVEFWRAMVEQMPGLHVFGYTARKGCGIAAAIDRLNRGPRCWIRRSDGEPGEFRAIVIDTPDEAVAQAAVICPAQTGRSACCGTCALCWATPKTIAFLRH